MVNDPITKKEDIETVKKYFLQSGNIRDYALFSLGINSGIKVSDLISLKWGDVYDASSDIFLSHIKTEDKKSGRKVEIALNDNCKLALSMLRGNNEKTLPTDYIFTSKKGGHITRIRAFQIIKGAAEKSGIEGNIGCKSMKKTMAYYTWTKTENL